jgi:hypothetical protein
MGTALKISVCFFMIPLIFAGCSNPSSNNNVAPEGQATVKSGAELQAALTDPKITDIIIAASFVSNVSAIADSPKTITIPAGYRVMIDALQVESEVTLTNSGSPSNAAGNLAAAGILIVNSKFMVSGDASFSVAGAAELAFAQEVAAGNAWIDGGLSAASAGSLYRFQQTDIAPDLVFAGSGSITLGGLEPAAPETITVTSRPILGNPKNSISEASNAENVVAIMTLPGAPTLAGGVGSINAAWDPVPGASAYQVWYSPDNDSEAALQSGPAVAGNSAVISGLAHGAAYYVWVRAVIGTWVSGFGPPADITTELPEYAIKLYDGETELEESSVLVLPSQAPGYTPAPSKVITIKNTGLGATGTLTVDLSGSGGENFVLPGLSGGSIAGIAAGESTNFAVAPKTGLAEGSYTAVVTLRGEQDLRAACNLSFTVSDTRIAGSISISFADAFPDEPELNYGNVELNGAGEIPLAWGASIAVQTGTKYYKTIWIDGEAASTLNRNTAAYLFNPTGLAPGPHTVTVFFSETQDGAFIAAAILQFRITK